MEGPAGVLVGVGVGVLVAVAAVAAGVMAVALALLGASLPIDDWLSYAPPPANPEVEFIQPGGSGFDLWYYNTVGLWVVRATRVESGTECQFSLGFDCLIQLYDSSEECQLRYNRKRFEPFTDGDTCQQFNAIRALAVASTLMTVLSALFLSITLGRSSAAHSLAAGVTLVFAGTLTFCAAMIVASLKTVTNYEEKTFVGNYEAGFALALSASMLLLLSAALAILVAEKGKKKIRYALADDDEDENAVNYHTRDDANHSSALNVSAAAAAASFNPDNR